MSGNFKVYIIFDDTILLSETINLDDFEQSFTDLTDQNKKPYFIDSINEIQHPSCSSRTYPLIFAVDSNELSYSLDGLSNFTQIDYHFDKEDVTLRL